MKSLLQAIQTALKNSVTLSYVADVDIFVTPDEDLIPVTASFPAIGLKDGAVVKEPAAFGGELSYTMNADVIVYQLLTAGETAIVGQTSPAIKGVLDMAADIDTVLRNNFLSIAGMNEAFCYQEAASETLLGENVNLQKKRLSYTYRKEV